MSKLKDLTGMVFGRLTVISRDKNDSRGNSRWYCRCECGSFVSVVGYALKAMRPTESCGCIRKESKTTHGKSGSPEYVSWVAMRSRCYDKNNIAYKDYGGRGINVCERWRSSFKHFLEDMGRKPSTKHSLDRIDNSEDYQPSNCRWSTYNEQASNTRRNIYLTLGGVTKCASAWEKESPVSLRTILRRRATGIPHDLCVNEPAHSKKIKTMLGVE